MTEKKNNTPTPKPSQGNRGERGGIGIGSVRNRKEIPDRK